MTKSKAENETFIAQTRTRPPTSSGVLVYKSDHERDSWDVYRDIYREATPILGRRPIRIGSTDISVERELHFGRPAYLKGTDFSDFVLTGFAAYPDWAIPVVSRHQISRDEVATAEFDAEVDRITSGRESGYAKLALARSRYVVDDLPKISQSPEGGIVLQSSTAKGSTNLIFEGDQAILVRTTDDFTVQVTCNLNPESVTELLEIYESELGRIRVESAHRY